MNTSQAKISSKRVIAETFSLNPSALITLFEIDITDLAFNAGLTNLIDYRTKKDTIFRFHNNINLTLKNIYWQGNEYVPAPIQIEGMQINTNGTQVTPKISMAVSDDGIPHLAKLKEKIRLMGDIVGGKIIRIRTHARFLDAINFQNPAHDFTPDPLAELPRDTFYIDRKSNENKNFIEYELSSLFDLDNVLLPARFVSQDNCPFLYRGEGCLYEFALRKNPDIHGDGNLPILAPPVANIFDEKISDIITGVSFNDVGEYIVGSIYNKGDYVHLKHRGFNYYFVSKKDNNDTAPLIGDDWIGDECSKRIGGCSLRYSTIGSGYLPYGAFPSVTRFR